MRKAKKKKRSRSGAKFGFNVEHNKQIQGPGQHKDSRNTEILSDKPSYFPYIVFNNHLSVTAKLMNPYTV